MDDESCLVDDTIDFLYILGQPSLVIGRRDLPSTNSPASTSLMRSCTFSKLLVAVASSYIAVNLRRALVGRPPQDSLLFPPSLLFRAIIIQELAKIAIFR